MSGLFVTRVFNPCVGSRIEDTGWKPVGWQIVSACEFLEPRRLLAATLDSHGTLSIVATAGNDVVGLSIKSSKLRVGLNSTTQDFSAASVKAISIDLGDGADLLVVGAGVGPVYCLGGLGNDTIYGGDGADTITAGGGKDYVSGGPGDDRIDGGPTADHLIGDDGNDRIYGGDANDTLEGVAGVDRLFGGAGNDSLSGGSSNDKLYGDAGDDLLVGGNQNDLLTGGTGNDTIHGGDGNDTLDGQDDDDQLFGEKGDDFAYGDNGNDSIDGGAGNDHLNGLAGDDTISGSADNDIIDGGDGNDSLTGGAGTDSVAGGNGNDALYGGADHDTLTGGAGADRFLQVEKDNDDAITDKTSDDAVMTFVNGDANWTDDEISLLDVGLGWIVARTNNTKLLKLSNGGEVAIKRIHDLGESVLGQNDLDGEIDIADFAFTFGPDGRGDESQATIVHELGHNWDTVDENPTVGTFFDISHWRKTNGSWTYDPNSDFASDYGRTDPLEDFATSFETYFSQAKGPALWMKKWDYINTFLDSMSTPTRSVWRGTGDSPVIFY